MEEKNIVYIKKSTVTQYDITILNKLMQCCNTNTFTVNLIVSMCLHCIYLKIFASVVLSFAPWSKRLKSCINTHIHIHQKRFTWLNMEHCGRMQHLVNTRHPQKLMLHNITCNCMLKQKLIILLHTCITLSQLGAPNLRQSIRVDRLLSVDATSRQHKTHSRLSLTNCYTHDTYMIHTCTYTHSLPLVNSGYLT